MKNREKIKGLTYKSNISIAKCPSISNLFLIKAKTFASVPNDQICN